MIVADASWVIALRDPSDALHSAAAAINRNLGAESVLLHPLTLAECLVAPARLGALQDAALRLRAAFEIPDVESGAPLRWAAMRAETGLRLPDAIVLDTALRQGARAVVTFDAQLASAAQAHGLDVVHERAPAADISSISGIAGDGGGPTDMARDKHRLIGEAVSALHDERVKARDAIDRSG